MDIRRELQQRRKDLNISQHEMAKLLDISPKHLSRIESCHQFPSIPLLYEMANILKCEIKLICKS